MVEAALLVASANNLTHESVILGSKRRRPEWQPSGSWAMAMLMGAVDRLVAPINAAFD
ncbi:MAG: hypothetical protein KTV68_01040 [Acidimicrobiia bacterium]|nr:hypothetical protein [Acidimicrobiia bacterium]MCY4434074.1 hypothetical protein [bacterium]